MIEVGKDEVAKVLRGRLWSRFQCIGRRGLDHWLGVLLPDEATDSSLIIAENTHPLAQRDRQCHVTLSSEQTFRRQGACTLVRMDSVGPISLT